MAVNFDASGPVAVLTFNRPDQRNSFDEAMTAAFCAALARFEADPALRVAVLTGAGRFFCSGMDLGAFAAGERPGLNTPKGFGGFVNLPRRKPVIAAVNGGAVAGGFEIMLACDLALAAHGAVFGLPEVKRGLVAAGGGAHRLARRIPAVVANEILLTGEVIDAPRALELGLLNRVVPADRLLPEALDLARRIAVNAPAALRGTLQLSRAASMAGEGALWAENAAIWRDIDGSADALEGARAFKEKREPVWRDI